MRSSRLVSAAMCNKLTWISLVINLSSYGCATLMASNQFIHMALVLNKCQRDLVLPGLNVWALLAKVDSVEATHLSSKLLGLLGCGTASNNGVLRNVRIFR